MEALSLCVETKAKTKAKRERCGSTTLRRSSLQPPGSLHGACRPPSLRAQNPMFFPLTIKFSSSSLLRCFFRTRNGARSVLSCFPNSIILLASRCCGTFLSAQCRNYCVCWRSFSPRWNVRHLKESMWFYCSGHIGPRKNSGAPSCSCVPLSKQALDPVCRLLIFTNRQPLGA